MINKKVCIELEVSCCFECPFLSCSEMGEDCRLLTNEIQEEEFSNIAFKFEKGWRYEKCPHCMVRIMKRFVKIMLKKNWHVGKGYKRIRIQY